MFTRLTAILQRVVDSISYFMGCTSAKNSKVSEPENTEFLIADDGALTKRGREMSCYKPKIVTDDRNSLLGKSPTSSQI